MVITEDKGHCAMLNKSHKFREDDNHMGIAVNSRWPQMILSQRLAQTHNKPTCHCLVVTIFTWHRMVPRQELIVSYVMIIYSERHRRIEGHPKMAIDPIIQCLIGRVSTSLWGYHYQDASGRMRVNCLVSRRASGLDLPMQDFSQTSLPSLYMQLGTVSS